MKRLYTICATLLATTFMMAQSEKKSLTPVQYFPPNEVHINSEDFLKNQLLDATFIHKLDPDRLLYYFRQTAKMANADDCPPYGGWEGTDLKGHTLGHYLTALSYNYAIYHRHAIKEKIDHIVEVLAECQDSIGTGYISAFPENKLDEADLTGQGWAPYYTLHKILQGLLDAYNYANSAQAITVASWMGDYIDRRMQKIDDIAQWQKNLEIMEVGGIAESLYNLYIITRKPEHLDAANHFNLIDSKILPAYHHRDVLNDRRTENFHHTNATIPQFIGVLRAYNINHNDTLLKAAENFWDEVVGHRTYCNGTTGYHEHWNLPPDHLSGELDIKAGETCCTYNLIKLSNDLFCINHQAKYAEYVERALFNDILGSIDPQTGNFMYFHTQKPGGFKTFGRNEQVFWCCTGSGMESHQRYGESFYFHSDNELYVNQFVSSTVFWPEKKLKMEQNTSFPDAATSILSITQGSGDFDLLIRHPSWCSDGFSIEVNGKHQTFTTETNGYVRIRRHWQTGDQLRINMPMHLHLETLKDAPQTAAILYGPIVLAGDLGREGVSDSLRFTTDYFYDNVPEAYKVHFHVPTLTGNPEKPSTWMHQLPGIELTFRTSATSNHKTVTFYPLYRLFNHRFADYWTFSNVQKAKR
jgi:uncharacterized protein